MKFIRKFISFLFSCVLITGMTVAYAADPVSMLQSVANRMIANLKANSATLKTRPGVVYSIAGKIIVPHADLAEMSKRVLPPATWNSATPAQRRQFQAEFTTTLIRTYASALAQYTDQQVKFFPVRGGYAGKKTVRVDSQIIRPDGGPTISVSYRLIARGGDWKLYDLSVEGVSMLESFRSQFADQLNRGNMASLIQVLKQHNVTNNG